MHALFYVAGAVLAACGHVKGVLRILLFVSSFTLAHPFCAANFVHRLRGITVSTSPLSRRLRVFGSDYSKTHMFRRLFFIFHCFFQWICCHFMPFSKHIVFTIENEAFSDVIPVAFPVVSPRRRGHFPNSLASRRGKTTTLRPSRPPPPGLPVPRPTSPSASPHPYRALRRSLSAW